MNLTPYIFIYISLLITCTTIVVKMIPKLGRGYGLGVPITKFVEPDKADTFKKVAFNIWFGLMSVTVIILIKVLYESAVLGLY